MQIPCVKTNKQFFSLVGRSVRGRIWFIYEKNSSCDLTRYALVSGLLAGFKLRRGLRRPALSIRPVFALGFMLYAFSLIRLYALHFQLKTALGFMLYAFRLKPILQ
jgi:hypothetical protein